MSHSSISAEERQRAEEAFARGEDCVIVATSTLELGIDVGDLDRVIQIDAPARVASFLQRLGRTGRRASKARNCLFLCTTDDSLLQGAALLDLWGQGYVEPIIAPPLPYHVVAQQALALCLQHGGMGRIDLTRQLQKLPLSRGIEETALSDILDYLLKQHFLETDGVRYFMGEAGEQTYGRRHFLELLSVFTSPPVLSVTDGCSELGMVDQALFQAAGADGKVISLAGRGWQVQRIDWKERRVYVIASETPGRSVWLGASRGLSLTLCQNIRKALTTTGVALAWSQRAIERLTQLREEYSFLKPAGTTLVQQGAELIWFTFAGDPVNSALGGALTAAGVHTNKTNDHCIAFVEGVTREQLEIALAGLNETEILNTGITDEEAASALKFADCVPPHLRLKELVARRCANGDVQIVLEEPRTLVITSS